MRLLTAIPLLFWVGTAAVASFVHACVVAPVDFAADLVTGDDAVEAAAPERTAPATSLGIQFHLDSGEPAVHQSEPRNADNPKTLSPASRTMREQVFASARLFANPPPFAA